LAKEKKEKKKKKKTSAVKYNTSGHYRGRRYNKLMNTSEEGGETEKKTNSMCSTSANASAYTNQ